MPSKSKAQHNFMEMIAHNKEMAKKKGVPQSVGKDFEKADKGKTFKKGGEMKKMAKGGMSEKEDMKQDKEMADKEIKKAFKQHDTQEHKGGKGTKLALKKGGMAKMAKGGMAKESMGSRSMKEDVEKGSNKLGKFGESKVQKSGHTRGTNLGDDGKKEPIETGKNMKSFMGEMKKGGKVKKYASGGSIKESSMGKVVAGGHRPHGEHSVQERGHTRAMMPKMKGRII
jgi:hypothetical protein